jgi:hypothetical protein
MYTQTHVQSSRRSMLQAQAFTSCAHHPRRDAQEEEDALDHTRDLSR